MQADDSSGPSLVLPASIDHTSHGVKRTHAEMAEGARRSHTISLAEPRAATEHHDHATHPRLVLPPLEPSIRSPHPLSAYYPTERARRAVDLRRPARLTTTAPNENIIDLTDGAHTSQPQPRTDGSATTNTTSEEASVSGNTTPAFIDLSAESSPPQLRRPPRTRDPEAYRSERRLPSSHSANNRIPTLRRETSDDLVFVEERPAVLPRMRHLPHNQNTTNNDVVETGTTVLPTGSNDRPRSAGTGRFLPSPSAGLNGLAQMLRYENAQYLVQRMSDAATAIRARDWMRREPQTAAQREMNRALGASGGTNVRAFMPPPPNLDYQEVGFPFGWILGQDEPRRERETSPYEAPAVPRVGFTRTPGEDEEVVCPCCGDELAMGDSDDKRQVWIIKACGHVYCGQCMTNRSKTKAKAAKGKARAMDGAEGTRPFAKCLVPDCNSKVSTRSSVLQLFL